MIRSHINSTRNCEIVLKFERFSYLPMCIQFQENLIESEQASIWVITFIRTVIDGRVEPISELFNMRMVKIRGIQQHSILQASLDPTTLKKKMALDDKRAPHRKKQKKDMGKKKRETGWIYTCKTD